jgi:MFS transporter, DHA1 family, multidrug resistance protein
MSDKQPAARIEERGGTALELLLGALTAIAPLSIDMYLPALPAIARDLRATPASVQLTLSSFFVGFALGQLASGPLIDRFGRKRPLLMGLAGYVAASWACAFAGSIEMLMAFRFLQALTASVAVVVPRALVRDLRSGAESARMLSRLMLVMGVAPILAPLIGGYLLELSAWRTIFHVLAAMALALLVWSARSLPEYGSRGAPLRSALRALLGERDFVRYSLAGGFGQAAMFAYIAGSSFAFIDLHGLTPRGYSLTFGLNAVGLISCAQLNRRLLLRVPAHAILRRAALFAFAVGCTLALVTRVHWGGAIALEVCLFLLISALGFIAPNSTALALEQHGARAGVASALLGSAQFTLAALASAAVGAMGGGDASAMGLVIAATTGLCVVGTYAGGGPALSR